MSHSDVAGCGARDHPEPAEIDVAGDKTGRFVQKCLQVLGAHLGVQTLRRAPLLVYEPDIGILGGLVQIVVEASGF